MDLFDNPAAVVARLSKRGLSPGLKNDPDQARVLEPYFEWALVESCFAEGWCCRALDTFRRDCATR